MNIYGIDTNHHHPITSWASVAAWLKKMNNGGPGFDMVRLGYSSRSGEGGLILDNIALASLKTCNRLGIPVGVYLLLRYYARRRRENRPRRYRRDQAV